MTKKKNYKADPSKSRYIAVQCALFEDTKFRNLSPYAKLVFFTIKGHLPLAELGQIFGIAELVSYKTGIPSDQIMGLVKELEGAGFLLREDQFFWIVRGLEHNPTYGKAHQGMNQNIRREVNKYKDIPLAKAFMAKYAYIWQEESDSQEELEGGSPEVSQEVSQEVSEGDPYLILSYSSKVVKDIVDTKNKSSRTKDGVREDQKEWGGKAFKLWCTHCGPIERKSAIKLVQALDPAVQAYGWERVLNTLEHYVSTTPSSYISSLGRIADNFTAKFLVHEAKFLGKDDDRVKAGHEDRELAALVADCIVEGN